MCRALSRTMPMPEPWRSTSLVRAGAASTWSFSPWARAWAPGLILNGRIFHGANAMAGEIGHVRLTETGPEGYNKAGSVEGWASGGGMAQHAAATDTRGCSDGPAHGPRRCIAQRDRA